MYIIVSKLNFRNGLDRRRLRTRGSRTMARYQPTEGQKQPDSPFSFHRELRLENIPWIYTQY